MSTETRQVTKIKLALDKTTVVWRQTKMDASEEISMTSTEPEAPSFRAAMQSLIPAVLEIGDLPDDYERGMEVIGLSYSGADGDGGVVITAKKDLQMPQIARGPLVINTPYIRLERLALRFSEAIETARTEALKYVDGYRAQAELPVEEE